MYTHTHTHTHTHKPESEVDEDGDQASGDGCNAPVASKVRRPLGTQEILVGVLTVHLKWGEREIKRGGEGGRGRGRGGERERERERRGCTWTEKTSPTMAKMKAGQQQQHSRAKKARPR